MPSRSKPKRQYGFILLAMTMVPPMNDARKEIEGRRFWDLYFQNKLVELERTPAELTGKYREDPLPGKSSFSEPRFGLVAIDRKELKAYDYERDGRFSQLHLAPASLQESIRRIIDRSYPYREPPPVGSEMMSELLQAVAARYDWPEDSSVTEETAIRTARSLLSPYRQEDSLALSALLWVLGERRERAYSETMVAVIEESERRPPGHKDRISATAVNTAFEALWKIDDKSHLGRLLELMERSEHSGRLRIAALFKRLLSTARLLSLEAMGEEYYSIEHWRRLIAPYARYSDLDWDRYDARSLFWEIRYLAAKRLPHKDEALRELADDEVSLVRELARRRSR